MSGPVTIMPTSTGSWTALWRYAMNFGMTTRRLQAAMQRAGYQVLIVAGEPQVRPADVEAYMASSQLQRAQPTPMQAKQTTPGESTTLEQRLSNQYCQIEALKRQIEQLLASKQEGAAK